MTAASGLPLVHQVLPTPRSEEAFLQLCCQKHVLFLDSARRHPKLGRYSFIAADPFAFVEVPADGSDGLQKLTGYLEQFQSTRVPDLPPFQGGAGGLFSYDLGRSLERIPTPRFDEFRVPAMSIGLYDVVLAFDHELNQAWIVSQGFPETEVAARERRARQRCQQMLDWLDSGDSVSSRAQAPQVCATNGENVVPVRKFQRPTGAGLHQPSGSSSLAAALPLCACQMTPAHQLAPQYPTGSMADLTSNFTAEGYRQAVREAVEYIHAGDVFQVNLAHRILYPAKDNSVSLYLRLRERNPAPFAGFFDLGEFQIVSASPERFLQVRDGRIETRPIKGTRQRTAWPEADLFAADDLRQSEKDRAENVMIVDLLRNDISRVCRSDSVQVTQLCGVETFEYVQHLVSAVVGELAPDRTPVDLIRATFPGGSITGAPKIRAMEIIAEIEPTARGAYCGALGYVGFDQSMDLSILIRTMTAGRGWWQLPVGGGIVAQSNPQREYEETWHKATGMVRALQ